MNVGGEKLTPSEASKVLPLFGNIEDELMLRPMQDLAQLRSYENDELVTVSSLDQGKARRVVGEDQFPDQSIYILEEQLKNLKESLKKIKFYLDDMDDLISG